MAGGRGRRATSLQPAGFGGGSGFSQSSSSNRLSRLNSQQDTYSSTSSSSYNTSSNIGSNISSSISSVPRSRRVSDIDNKYYSSSNGGKIYYKSILPFIIFAELSV